jgi:hypothetical protein
MELVLINCGCKRNQVSNICASLNLPATSTYRIYVRNDHKIILSKDVQFQERINDCISKVKLPMKDIENNDQVEEENRSDEQKIDTEGKSEINSEDS